jgi:hypothetical protein
LLDHKVRDLCVEFSGGLVDKRRRTILRVQVTLLISNTFVAHQKTLLAGLACCHLGVVDGYGLRWLRGTVPPVAGGRAVRRNRGRAGELRSSR